METIQFPEAFRKFSNTFDYRIAQDSTVVNTFFKKTLNKLAFLCIMQNNKKLKHVKTF
jgi:hypothetical protein